MNMYRFHVTDSLGGQKKKSKVRDIPVLHNGAVFVSDYKNRRKGYLVCFLDNSKYFLDNKICNSIWGTREVTYHVSEFLEKNIDCQCPCNDTWVNFSDIKPEYVYGTNVDCFETSLYTYEKEIIDLFHSGKFDEFMKKSKTLKTKFIKLDRIEFDQDGHVIERVTLATL